MAFDPINNPIDALRLEFGDTDEYDQVLTDESYQYFINKYGDSPRNLRKQLGGAILAKFAKEGYRQRVGQEDAYKGERYKNYFDWLRNKIEKPFLSGNLPAVYIAGVDRMTVAEYETRMDLIDSVFYRGQTARKPDWKSYRYFYPRTVVEPEEIKFGR